MRYEVEHVYKVEDEKGIEIEENLIQTVHRQVNALLLNIARLPLHPAWKLSPLLLLSPHSSNGFQSQVWQLPQSPVPHISSLTYQSDLASKGISA